MNTTNSSKTPSEETLKEYTKEAQQRWGDTDAFKQSQERTKKMSKEEISQAAEASSTILKEIAAHMLLGPENEIVQNLVKGYYDSFRAFYDPTPEIYRGLADIYMQDDRFKETFETIAPGLAQFMHDAMIAFCDTMEAGE